MMEILFFIGIGLCLLTSSSFFINDIVYEKYHIVFFLINVASWMVILIVGGYLIIPSLLGY
jgi:hypothetical protein